MRGSREKLVKPDLLGLPDPRDRRDRLVDRRGAPDVLLKDPVKRALIQVQLILRARMYNLYRVLLENLVHQDHPDFEDFLVFVEIEVQSEREGRWAILAIQAFPD